ncbi:MAG: AmmeMemoRadiSam system radical SAM enzyme [Candidatus Asgardarchaeia archaeon]
MYERLPNNNIKCHVCSRECVVHENEFGMCKDRYNYKGKFYVLTYGNISSISCNPIEKKPFFHFWPGSYALTVGSWSCNFLCPWCQNYEISKEYPINHNCVYIDPERFIELTISENCQGTSFSFNEPSVSLLEYSIDVMKLARKKNLYNTYVTNGYFSEDALKELVKAGLDAMNIDIKGCSPKIDRYIGAKNELVWDTAKKAVKLGVHVEITTLVIPNVNDSLECLNEISSRIVNDLGNDIPWHITRFFPYYKASKFNLDKITPISTLEKAYKIGKQNGLKYVYIGNVPGHPLENTYCPNCGKILIRRVGFSIAEVNLTEDNRCPSCGTKIKMVGKISKN